MPPNWTRRSVIFAGGVAGVVFVGDVVALPYLINVVTGGRLPAALEPFRMWAFPLILVWTIGGFVAAVAARRSAGRGVVAEEESLIRKASNLRLRNRYFTGRAKLIDQVRRNLDRPGPVAVMARPWSRVDGDAHALHGMPGVGKTESRSIMLIDSARGTTSCGGLMRRSRHG
jgi:hypothetical protein